jgi:hypothetical protein
VFCDAGWHAMIDTFLLPFERLVAEARSVRENGGIHFGHNVMILLHNS